MKKIVFVRFWLLGIASVVMVAQVFKTIDESIRWSVFLGLFAGAVCVFVAGKLSRAQQERAEIRERRLIQIALAQARELEKMRGRVQPGHVGARRSSAASRSSSSAPVSPATAYDPAYPVSGFEVSPSLISVFDSSPPSCDSSPPDSSSSSDSSSSYDSSCSTDSSGGGSAW